MIQGKIAYHFSHGYQINNNDKQCSDVSCEAAEPDPWAGSTHMFEDNRRDIMSNILVEHMNSSV